VKAIRFAAPLFAALAIAACNAGGSSNVPSTTGESAAVTRSHPRMPQWELKGLARAACPQVTGQPTCLALLENGKPGIKPAQAGWAPSNIQARYNLPSSTNGSGQIVAIVDAYDNPDVASNLAEYRSNYGLGTANFTKYNQTGQTSNYPSGNVGWGLEIDLDVQMVSAACPLCTIYLVEANSSDKKDLDAAEVEAVKLGAHIVSNSWISYGCQGSGCPAKKDFDTPGVVYVAGSGDAGYDENGGPESFPNVVSAGGTVLAQSGSTYTETVWDDAGGGCSSNGGSSGQKKPKWQTDPDCKYRTDADVSALAWDVAEYDSYGYGGWLTVGGTSVATPLTAAVFALAGNASSQHAGEAFWSASQSQRNADLHYISSGNDGSCGGEYLCEAGTNQFGTYSGPSGWGTPNGVGLY
jgi:hypothetical protein